MCVRSHPIFNLFNHIIMEARKLQLKYLIVGIGLLALFLFVNYILVVVQPLWIYNYIPYELLWIYKYAGTLLSLILRVVVVYISMHICERIDCGIFWIILIGLIAILIPGLALIIQYFLKPSERILAEESKSKVQ